MSGLLDEERLDALSSVALSKVYIQVEGLRSIIWRGTPPGMKRLSTDVEKQVFAEEMQVKAQQEQRGQIPGDLNTVTVNNPVMQQVLGE